jgi:hypothetical protein
MNDFARVRRREEHPASIREAIEFHLEGMGRERGADPAAVE